ARDTTVPTTPSMALISAAVMVQLLPPVRQCASAPVRQCASAPVCGEVGAATPLSGWGVCSKRLLMLT
ncbi:hypothetical protein, partial [Acetobacter okinawensis]|uniref:hypothetical protein n=1 Tax=Acetobacter okinawensis TaxID=1076594 RepID=UPI001BA65409